MTKLVVAFAFLGLNFYVYNFLASQAVLPPRETFESFPRELEAWSCADPVEMDASVERNLGVTDYLLCDFQRSQPLSWVNVYVGYHASQVREEGGGAAENSIHPPAHCLPGSGWNVIQSDLVTLESPGLPGDGTAHVNRMVIAKGEARSLVYYWYQSRGRVVAEDWKKVVYVGWDRAVKGRTDGSLVRFTIPVIRGDEERADEIFREFAPLVLERLPAYVPS